MDHRRGWTQQAPHDQLRTILFPEIAKILKSTHKRLEMMKLIQEAMAEHFVFAQVIPFDTDGYCKAVALGDGSYDLYFEGEEEPRETWSADDVRDHSPQVLQRELENVASAVVIAQALAKAFKEADLNALRE